MKVSLGKFYSEATGANTGSSDTITKALKRWGIPYDESAKRHDRVDVTHLDAARQKYADEQEARLVRAVAHAAKRAKSKYAPSKAVLNSWNSVREAIDALRETIAVQGQVLGRMEDMLNHIHKDLYATKHPR